MRLLPVQWGWYIVGNPLCRFFLRPTVSVPDDLSVPADYPLIIAMNHISRFDPFTVCLLPRPLLEQIVPITPLASRKYYDVWWMKPFIWAFGSVPIKQFGWSLDDYLGTAVASLKSGRTMLLFPEGQLNPQKQTAKPGIGYLQSETKAYVLPIKIEGIRDITLKDFFLRRCKLSLRVGNIFQPQTEKSGYAGYQNISDQIMRNIYSAGVTKV